jgi:hypothetical protein
VGLILFNGFISRPGGPPEAIHLQIGYPIALVATLAITYAATLRAALHQAPKRPPGTLGLG